MKAIFHRIKPVAMPIIKGLLALSIAQHYAYANDIAPTSHGLVVKDADIDISVAPGDDFNRFANGEWDKTAVIPDDKAQIGIDDKLSDESDSQVQAIIEKSTKAEAGTPARKVGDYYQAYLNVDAINQRGLAPLEPQLLSIVKLNNKTELASYLGEHLRADVDPLNATHLFTTNLFGLWISQGFHDNTKYIGYLLQGGLGMADREYYLSSDPKMAKLRTKYRAYIVAMLNLAKVPDAERAATRVLDLEIKIAKGHATRAATTDVLLADNTWRKADFTTKASGLDWNAYFKAARLEEQSAFIVWHPGAIKTSAALVASTSLQTWKDYLLFHAINKHAQVLPQAFFDQQFKFYAAFSGETTELPRWKYAVNETNRALGEEIGKLYVEKNFSPEAKAQVNGMVHNILAAFSKRIDALSWMSPNTKQEAQQKLKATYVGVGYPDKWRDYSGLTVDKDDAYGNAERSGKFKYQQALAKFNQAVDETEWCMNPQLVNAVNMPLQNAISFPAAYLQPPFFDLHASIAANYGAIGATIGHEISHNFDHAGAMFDSKGELRNWWSKDDLSHFTRSTKALSAQFSTYKPFPDLAINGEQTLDENLADLAGLSASYDAYHAAMQQLGLAATRETDREFFLSFARMYRGKIRDEYLRMLVVSDGHSPNRYRMSTVRNLDAWYSAFDVKPGQELYLAPADRVRVW